MCIYVFVLCACMYMYWYILIWNEKWHTFYLFPMIRLNMEDVHSSCYCSRLFCYPSILPYLNNSVWISKWDFCISWFFTHNDLIQHPITLLDSIWIFTDGFSFYLCFLELIDVSEICYMFDWYDRVMAKNHLEWSFILNYVVCWLYHKWRWW